jgi:superfamily II DNA or RNA helicase
MSKHAPDKFKHICDVTDVLCMDEAHTFASNVTLATANKFYKAKWRTGTTGTLDDSKINKLQLIGLMSEPYQVITTRELMDQKSVVNLDIKVCKLQYPDVLKQQLIGMDYKAEINYLVTYEPRNRFIADLAKNTKGVTLVLYTYIEKHGAVLDKYIREICPNRTVKFIHGGVDVEDREEVRRIAETDENCIIIASSAIFSTGTNIPSIENVIFAMPTKSTIRVRQ